MTDREKHLSLALDALTKLEEGMVERPWMLITEPGENWIRQGLKITRRHIEAAAMPKPSIIRRWFGREGRAA
jgi:hypothetical protein